MKRFSSARGEVRLSSVITVLVILFAVYEGAKFAPALFAQYEFGDAMEEQAKFAARHRPEKRAAVIRTELTEKARKLGLPITIDMIRVDSQPTKIRIQVNYQLSVEWLPGREYTWNVNEVAESVLF